MVFLERRIVQLFRAAVKRCTERPTTRADQVPVQIRLTPDGLQMHASMPDVTVIYSQPEPVGNDVFTFPLSRLGEWEGRTADLIEIGRVSPDLASVRWPERGRQRQMEIPLLEPETMSPLPELPKKFTAMPSDFLQSLYDVSQTTADEPTKYLVNRVQFRGKHGTIAGTDTRQLLVCGGFKFPFTEDLLLPRATVFGLPPFRQAEDVGIARTAKHVAIRVSPWTIVFRIDTDGRFPDFAAIVPRPSNSNMRLRLAAEDGQRFLDSLARRVKGSGVKDDAVTLDTHEVACLRFELEGRVTEVKLVNSQFSGKPTRICFNLPQLLRMLELRFNEFEIRDPDKPIVARDGERLFLSMLLSPILAIPPCPNAYQVPDDVQTPTQPLAVARRGTRSPVVISNSPVVPAQSVAFDLLDEAEGLRDGLFKVASHAGRILRFLRETCTQQQLLHLARTSLLALGTPTNRGGTQ